MENILSITDYFEPQILAAEKDFLIVYKPAGMHSAPLGNSQDTILKWCSAEYPEILELSGKDDPVDDDSDSENNNRQASDGGLLHRLDYDTHGLMIIARTPQGMDSLIEQQRHGKIFKEYCALTAEKKTALPGFPDERPIIPFWVFREKHRIGDTINIRSAFRPYGPGRKEVRPVVTDVNIPYTGNMKIKNQGPDIALDGNRPYVTNIITGKIMPYGGVSGSVDYKVRDTNDPVISSFRLGILRGFRHQIRCHLAWVGRPILNDGLYGGISFGNGSLALRAFLISFADPCTGAKRVFAIEQIKIDDVWN